MSFLIFSKFLSVEIFWPTRHIFGFGVVISQTLIRIGLEGTLYDPLVCWETILTPVKIRKSRLETFGLISAFLAFMVLGVKFLQLAEFLCQNGPHKAKKLQNFNKCSCGLVCGLWKKNWPFLFFWRFLIPTKSSGIQKSCMWVVFPPYQKPSQNFHSGT